MVYQLAGFHFMLNVNGITTYEYIVRESNKAHERKVSAPASSMAGTGSSNQRQLISPEKYRLAKVDGDVELTSL